MPRLFVAVDLSEEIQDQLAEISFGLPDVGWTPPEQLHLTLRFIGEVEGGHFRDIQEALEEVVAHGFTLTLRGVDYFPVKKDPRILWAGVEKNEKLTLLRNKIEHIVIEQGIEPEGRKFTPHITLGRVHDTPPWRVQRYLEENLNFHSSSMEVTEFHLYSSLLTPKGAIHTLESTYPLLPPTS